MVMKCRCVKSVLSLSLCYDLCIKAACIYATYPSYLVPPDYFFGHRFQGLELRCKSSV